MTSYIMAYDEKETIKVNLDFKLLFPLFRNVDGALMRFHQAHDTISKLSSNPENKPLCRSLLLECDYILNVLETYDL